MAFILNRDTTLDSGVVFWANYAITYATEDGYFSHLYSLWEKSWGNGIESAIG